MLKPVFLISVLLLLSLSSFSQDEHPYLVQVKQLLTSISHMAQQKPLLDKSVFILAGASTEKITEHYLGLIGDVASMIEPKGDADVFDSGSNENGYFSALVVFKNKNDTILLKKYFPKALEAYKAAKAKEQPLSWTQYLRYFDNNPKLALQSLIMLSGWVRNAVGSADLVDLARMAESENFYYPGVFSGRPFGLNFEGGSPDGFPWGTSYKTIAGISLGFALHEKGYSAEDIVFAVSRAALVYEASDLLYDHLGKENTTVYQLPDNKNVQLAAFWDQAMLSVIAKLNRNPKILHRMLGSLVGMESLVALSGKYMNLNQHIDLKNEMQLTMLLLAYYKTDSNQFMRDLGEAFSDGISPEKTNELLYQLQAGIKDIQSIEDGSIFAVQALALVPQANKKYKGAIRRLQKAEAVVDWLN